mgnify:CR=1 FL=1
MQFHDNAGFRVFIANQKLIEDEDKLLFHVKHNWFYRSGDEFANQTIPLNDDLRLLTFQNKTLFRMDSTMGKEIPMTDFVFLENIAFLDKRIVADFNDRNVRVILGQGVAFRLKQFLADQLLPMNLHVLKEEGAFVLNF